MKSIAIVLAALTLAAFPSPGQRQPGGKGPGPGPGGRGASLEKPPQGKDEAEKKVLAVIEQVRAAGEVYLEVPVTDGRMLRVLAESIGAKSVVEVGTSMGYSGMWLCLALQKTGGKLTTFEIDPGRAALARKHFQMAGVDRLVTIVEGDAHQNVTRVKGPVDLVFIDADKEGYLDYLNKLLPAVRPGGLILAHNITSARDYVDAINTNPDLESVFYMQGNGLGVTLKKR
jgi:predicted O-methyltransferase YrrM